MIFELIVMLVLAVGGSALAMLLGARNRWLALPFGLSAVICLRMVTYALAVVIQLREYATAIFYVAVAAIVVYAVLKFRKQLIASTIVASIAAVAAWFIGRVLALKPQIHSDSTWILVMSHLFESGGDPALLKDKVPFKRGFDYPLMLALGPSNEYLSALTPYIFLATIAAIAWGLSVLLESSQKTKRLIAIYGSAVALVALTATMTIRNLTYINGHTLTGLGVVLMAITVTNAARKQKLDSPDLAILLVSIATVSTTRPEGILICVMTLLPLLASRFVTRVQLMLLASAATVSLAVWLSLYNSYIIIALGIGPIIFSAILIAAGLLPWVKWFDAIRYRLVPIALISMALVIVAAEVVFFRSMQEGNQALFVNLVLGAGLWGLLFPFLAVVFALVGYRKRSAEYKSLAVISITLIMSFIIAKMLDRGQVGQPDLGRIGWSDSLNRMWMHLLPLLLITAIIGLVEKHRSLEKLETN